VKKDARMARTRRGKIPDAGLEGEVFFRGSGLGEARDGYEGLPAVTVPLPVR